MSHTQHHVTILRPSVSATRVGPRTDVESMLRDMAFVCRLTAQVKAAILADRDDECSTTTRELAASAS